MHRFKKLMPLVIVLLIAGACSSDDDGGSGGNTGATGGGATGVLPDTGTVNVMNAMEPEEVTAIQAIVDENIDADYTVELEADPDFEANLPIRAEGGTLDVALVPQPGAVQGMAADGSIVSLEDMGFDIDALSALFGDYYLSLGEVDGKHYGLPTNINLKSMIWYPKKAFDAAGYTVPETWDDLMALTDQIKADGGVPWCVGFESGGATGWPATDWMEDIMLRTAGVDTYDQWVSHEIPFNDPAVANAAEVFGDVMFPEGNVLGGAADTPSIAFGDAPGPMFQDPPGCWLHRQASFINAFFPEGTVAGTDYDWFPFPPIDQQGVLGAQFPAVHGTRPGLLPAAEGPDVHAIDHHQLGVELVRLP